MLAADYRDRKACPECGMPVRRLGRWFVLEGQWQFKPQALSARIKRGSRPEYDGQNYSNIPERIQTTDRQGRTIDIEEDVWHDLRHFECMGTVYGTCNAQAPFRECDVVDYRGEEHEWMRVPSPPEKRDVTAEIERQRAAAGDAS